MLNVTVLHQKVARPGAKHAPGACSVRHVDDVHTHLVRNILQHRDAVLVGESGLTVAARHLQTPRNGERKRREEWPNSPRSRAVLASYMLQKQESNRAESNRAQKPTVI